MTSQEAEPLVLKDELVKMVREAKASAWLMDANSEIEAWRVAMPGVERIQLHSSLRDDGSLEIHASDGWGGSAGIGLYTIEANGVRFYPGQPPLMPNCTLCSEQAFIGHLLQLLQKKLGISQ